MDKYDLIIVGAGAAGLFAAVRAKGLRVLVLEKNNTPGKKLLISGSGRCNITHEGKISDFFIHFGDKGKFLKNALYAFPNKAVVDFFENNKVETITDKNGKIFPKTQQAKDILDAFLKNMLHCDVLYNAQVVDVSTVSGIFEVKTSTGTYYALNVLLTTGGMSYPHTGSSGDGYQWAKQWGHTVIPPKPALVPVYNHTLAFDRLMGVSLSQMPITLYRQGKKIKEHVGDIVFTHKGVSGPGILDFSRFIVRADILKINFSKQQKEDFHALVLQHIEHKGKATVNIVTKTLNLPKSLILFLFEKVNIDYTIKLGELTRMQRLSLVDVFTDFSIEVERLGSFSSAMVTNGGVSLNEINPKTMESKLVNGLYFAGEVMDIDGDTGGYNLQAAFSTAYVAINSIKNTIKRS